MHVRDGFLLIELLVAIAVFVLFATAISRLHLETLKTSRMATQRMQLLQSVTRCFEAMQRGQTIASSEKNNEYQMRVENLAVRTAENHMFNFVKIAAQANGCTVELVGALS